MWTVRVVDGSGLHQHRDIVQLDDASGVVSLYQLQELAPGLRDRVEVARYEAPTIAHMDVFWA